MSPCNFPPFHPHRLFRGGHAQTLAGLFLPSPGRRYQAVQHRVLLPDGDAVVLHDDRPAAWSDGDHAALLVHGLSGCHLSPYMVRIGGKLNDRGIRTFRMDHRGCGAGFGMALHAYHAGRSDDIDAAVRHVAALCPQSTVSLIGFSLSGNIVLKYLGETSDAVPPQVVRGMAVNPSIDLEACVRGLARPENRIYDRYFARSLHRQIMRLKKRRPDVVFPAGYTCPRTLLEFDDRFTAPAAGFRDARDYYARCSSAQFLSAIRCPTLILAARDDPLIPAASFERLSLPATVSLHIADHGGHLGFVARSGIDSDRRWLDWRVVDWVTAAEV